MVKSTEFGPLDPRGQRITNAGGYGSNSVMEERGKHQNRSPLLEVWSRQRIAEKLKVAAFVVARVGELSDEREFSISCRWGGPVYVLVPVEATIFAAKIFGKLDLDDLNDVESEAIPVRLASKMHDGFGNVPIFSINIEPSQGRSSNIWSGYCTVAEVHSSLDGGASLGSIHQHVAIVSGKALRPQFPVVPHSLSPLLPLTGTPISRIAECTSYRGRAH